MNSEPIKIIVVGGGSSGIIFIHKLIDCYTKLSEVSQGSGLEITLVEKDENGLATGLPYRPAAHICLLNHPIKHMSPFEDDPAHFYKWCRQNKIRDHNGALVSKESYPSRAIYGEYLKSLYEQDTGRVEVLQSQGFNISLKTVHDEIVDIEETRGTSNVTLFPKKSEVPLEADFVVLALGHQASAPLESMRNIPGYFHNPIQLVPNEKAENPNFGSNVVVLGTGPSMIDAVRILEYDDSYFGHITLVSSNGLLPYLNDASDTCAYQKRFLTPENLQNTKTADALIGLIKSEIESVRESFDHPNPHVPALFNISNELPSELLPQEELLKFSKQYGSYWMHYMTQPTAPESYALIERLKNDGLLSIVSGRVDLDKTEYVPKDPNSIKLHFKPVLDFSPEGAALAPVDGIMSASTVVNCLGVAGGIQSSTDPLIKNLLKKGILHPNVLGSGCCVDQTCSITDPKGNPQENLFLIGPLGAPPMSGFGIPVFSRRISHLVDHLMTAIVTREENEGRGVVPSAIHCHIPSTSPALAQSHTQSVQQPVI